VKSQHGQDLGLHKDEQDKSKNQWKEQDNPSPLRRANATKPVHDTSPESDVDHLCHQHRSSTIITTL